MKKKYHRQHVAEKAIRNAVHPALVRRLRWNKADNKPAFEAFDSLVDQGCDGEFLVKMLDIAAGSDKYDTWPELTGFPNARRLRTVLRRIKRSASEIETLLEHPAGRAASLNLSVKLVPDILDRFATSMDRIVRTAKPGRNMSARSARALIVHHVQQKTGSPRDRLVAAILDPTLICDENTQIQWRRDNETLFFAVRHTQD